MFEVTASSISLMRVAEKRRRHWLGMNALVETQVDVISATVGVSLLPSKWMGTNASSSSRSRGSEGSCRSEGRDSESLLSGSERGCALVLLLLGSELGRGLVVVVLVLGLARGGRKRGLVVVVLSGVGVRPNFFWHLPW